MRARSRDAILVAALVAVPMAAAAGQATGTPASPAAPSATEMPKPAAEMAQLKLFEGNWACQGTMSPSPFGPGGTMRSTMSAQSALGGFWQAGTVKGTMAGMPPFEGMYHTTYDPAAKRYVMLWVDNMGAWAQSTAPGWTGDTMVFTGDTFMGGQKVASRDTFTKAADGSFKHVAEVQMAGQWTKMFEETCRSSAAR